jgi:surface polysaccharide O-acyltransferase-like enzyme
MKTEANGVSRTRLFYLDNFRVFLTILVILHHAAIAYGGIGDWGVKDPAVDEISPILLTFVTAVNQSYFMSAFFFIAGYFTPRSLELKGASAFIKDRFIRLGIPILVYTTLIVNINQLTLDVWQRGLPFKWKFTYSPGHLWFLQALLIFALVYLAYRAWANRSPGEQRFRFSPDQFPSNLILVISVIALSLLTFIARIEYPVGEWVPPGFQLAHFVHYIFAFFAGILAYRGDWLNRMDRDQARRWGVVALIMLPLFFVIAIMGGALESDAALTKFLGGVHWQSLVYTTWESILFIAALVFLLHFFQARFNESSPGLKSMAGSVFTVYIIHQPILFALNVLFLSVQLPTIIKFVIVSLISVLVCFLLAALIRRLPYTEKVLG